MKAKKSKFSSIYIFPVLFLFICLSYTIRFLFFNIETEIVKYDSVENSITAQALILRTEWVNPLPAGVDVNYKVNEGERVSFGKKILEIMKNNQADENMAIKIKQLDDRIKEIKQAEASNNFFPQDKERIEKSINDNVTELKDIAKSGNYEKLDTVKANLVADQYKKSLIYGSDSFSGKNLEQLVKEKNALEKIYKNNIDDIYAQNSGIVSFNVDGYEQVLNPAHLKEFKLKDIKELINSADISRQSNKKTVSSGIKIVDNYEWYICSIIDKNNIEGIKPGKKIKLRFGDFDNTVVNGEVYDISEPTGDECLVTVKISEYIKDFYKQRVAKVEIIKDIYEGFVVSSKSIVVKDNIRGVYVVKSGLVKFVPVAVMTPIGDKELVRNVNKEDAGFKPGTDMLKIFDEVITTTKRVKENQVLTDKI
ncbi:MAG: HlyD family efflux transporter periplasmic adaptor subunit [Caulobacteraceae bacterium]